MKIINPSYEIVDRLNKKEILEKLERCGRVCYKSEDKISETSSSDFVKMIKSRKHESVLEHVSFTVKFVFDRGVSHEIVRHRLASFSQESTRYCNYSKGKFNKEITVIKPCFFDVGSEEYEAWSCAMQDAERAYFKLINLGASPQEARSVLPNSLKTEIYVTANLREWMHIFRLRTSAAAHPQMREVMCKLYDEVSTELPEIYEDCGER